MKPARFFSGRTFLKMTCAAALLGSAAQARLEACDAASAASPGHCVALVAAADLRETTVRGERLAATHVVGPTSMTASRTVWQPDRRIEAAAPAEPLTLGLGEGIAAAPSNEPPLLGLLLAALGVVAFVAHRRSGR